eukprot:365862-Chlamydomonas_euryale.AAC.1
MAASCDLVVGSHRAPADHPRPPRLEAWPILRLHVAVRKSTIINAGLPPSFHVPHTFCLRLRRLATKKKTKKHTIVASSAPPITPPMIAHGTPPLSPPPGGGGDGAAAPLPPSGAPSGAETGAHAEICVAPLCSSACVSPLTQEFSQGPTTCVEDCEVMVLVYTSCVVALIQPAAGKTVWQ